MFPVTVSLLMCCLVPRLQCPLEGGRRYGEGSCRPRRYGTRGQYSGVHTHTLTCECSHVDSQQCAGGLVLTADKGDQW